LTAKQKAKLLVEYMEQQKQREQQETTVPAKRRTPSVVPEESVVAEPSGYMFRKNNSV
jgi:hypothetical protein